MNLKATLTPQQLQNRLSKLPHMQIGHLPTPLEELPNLSAHLGRRIFVKREDLTGLAYGGNKARHYEYQIPHIQLQGYDTLINIMNYHSNNARMTAAASNKAGLDYVLVVTDGVEAIKQGNLLVDKLLCKEIHLLDRFESINAMDYAISIAKQLESKGRKPYLIQKYLFPKIAGMIAYVGCALELLEQVKSNNLTKLHIIGVAGRSLCGLAAAAINLGLDWKFSGVQVTYEPTIHDYIFQHAKDLQDALDLPLTFNTDNIRILTDYVGEGYSIMNATRAQAIRLAAQTEALICDPNYTGRVIEALVDRVNIGDFNNRETIIVLHTGGIPGVFTFAEQLARF